MNKVILTKEYEEKLLNNYSIIVREFAKQTAENADILMASSFMKEIKVPVKKRILYKISQVYDNIGMLFLRIFFRGLYKDLNDWYNYKD